MAQHATPYPLGVSTLGSTFSVANQATLQNAAGFSLVLLPASIYLVFVQLYFFTQGATNGGWRFGFTYSGTFSVPNLSFIGGMVTTGGAYNGSFLNLNGGTLTSLSNANPDFGQYTGIINTLTGGTLQTQFAQNTSNATASQLLAGSAIASIKLA